MVTNMITKMRRIISLSAITGMLLLVSGCADNNETPPPEVPFVTGEVVTVDQVKSLYAEELAKPWQQRLPVEITRAWTLRGVITASDKKDGNLYKEAFIQDATTGLRKVFESISGFYIGDSVLVNVKGLWLGDYGNFIQMGSEPYTDDSGNLRVAGFNMDKHISKISAGNATLPVTATIPQVKSAAWLGRLVKLENVQFDDDQMGRTWADAQADPPAAANRDLVDCSKKSIIVRTSGYASFAGETLPAGNGTITGIVTVFNGDYQLLVRDYSEVVMEGNRCGYVPQPQGNPVESLSQDFNTFKDNATIYIAGWQNLASSGGRLWLAKLFSGNAYAQATGYNSQLASMVTWLVTNPVILTSQKVLSFETAKAYWNHTGDHQPLEVLFSTDFNGNNLTTATWTPLTGGRLAQNSDPDHTFIPSGDILLPVMPGKTGTVAFRYTGSDSESTTSRIDNIVIKPAN